MSWNFLNQKQMYNFLVGNFYGPDPEKNAEFIAQSRHEIAKRIATYFSLKKESIALEVGSGAGHMAQFFASQVKHLYCVDISESFLQAAEKTCKTKRNISYHLISNFDLHFIKDHSVDVIFSHAVFIHLNLYDVFHYLNVFSRILSERGRIYFDFLSADQLVCAESVVFQEHANNYKSDQSSLPLLLSYQSEKVIKKIAKQLGFIVLHSHEGPNNTVGMVLEKRNGTSWLMVQWRRVRFSATLSFKRGHAYLKAYSHSKNQ